MKSRSVAAMKDDGKSSCMEDLSPTLLYTTFAKTKGGRRLGTLMDNGSTDDYVLNSVARQLGLVGQPVELITEGFGGIETKVSTNLYYVPIYDKLGRTHHLPCYGTDVITKDSCMPDLDSYEKMCQKFNVNPKEVPRPRKIELLISLRSSYLHPNDSECLEIGGMRLSSGLLGRVFGGCSPDLKFNPVRLACPTSAVQIDLAPTPRSSVMRAMVREATFTTPLRTDKEILNFFNEEQIGIQCEPRCGDCRCGGCIIGSKQMSIREEKEYEKFKTLMFLDTEGSETDPGPYWRTGYPWTVEPEDLVNNKAAVAAVMHSTERKLNFNSLISTCCDQ